MVDYLIEKITDHEEEDAEEENKDNNGDGGVPPSINNNRKDVVQELLLQVYMKLPNCLIHLTSDSAATSLGRLLPSEVTSFGNTSVVDCISHTVLSALAATQHGRSWVSARCTGLRHNAVPMYSEFCSCYCLPLLSQLASNILATWERPYRDCL